MFCCSSLQTYIVEKEIITVERGRIERKVKDVCVCVCVHSTRPLAVERGSAASQRRTAFVCVVIEVRLCFISQRTKTEI